MQDIIFNHQSKHVIYIAIIMDNFLKINGLSTVFIFIRRQIHAWHMYKYMRCYSIFTKMDKVYVKLCLEFIQLICEG